jgi:hypothetical protein
MDFRGIVYIGETHGTTCSLWGRLVCFGNSAGFYGKGQRNGHYAAWGFPYLLGANGREVAKGIWKCEPDNVWVAVSAWKPGAIAEECRGLFPTAVEQRALWAYTIRWKDLPRLNNTGRVPVRPVPPMPPVTDEEVHALLAWSKAPGAAEQTAKKLADRLAAAMKYEGTGARLVSPGEYGLWTGIERKLGKAEYLYLGRSEFDPSAVTLTAFERDHCSVDAGQSRTPAEVRAAIKQFWDYWSPE